MILGIWDGHDSGAALMDGGKILFAVNEERLTRRKLEVRFPERSIDACLEYAGIGRSDITDIALSTSDFAKTLTRVFPSLKEEYYLIRRRKRPPKGYTFFKKRVKYRLTEFSPSFLTDAISRKMVDSRLKRMGFDGYRLHLIDHHESHAAAAGLCSGFDRGVVITMDGLGDGLSGSIYVFTEPGRLERRAVLSARHSLGIFFEHVTNLMNMRELEDEGKVMALANYAYPIEDSENPLMDLITVEGLSIRCSHSSLAMYEALKKILWQYPSEQFAYMAQRTLEVKIVELVKNAMGETGMGNLCLAGGIFSNVKVNRLLRLLPGVEGCFVFPHMGDGGLATGSAIEASRRLEGITRVPLDNVFLGPSFNDEEIEAALRDSGLKYYRSDDIASEAAEIIAKGGIVFWFQGAMELGPRALGGRSILARADSEDIKDALNLRLKKRVWYQPFCPSMLEEDAADLLADYDGRPNRFMTMAYMVKEDKRKHLKGVINVDGSCRPQIVPSESSLYGRLLEDIKRLTGYGCLLNTSLNVHGEPMVCSPRDAVKTMIDTGNEYLAIGNFMVKSLRVS
ncbi:MAG: carbamoyltransferase C-terminal domain-containing protein [Syntrophales bacterium]|nr:carbamoyltransferase C-terminal domain-containing protein [Syntrophales bacterium]